MSAVRLAVNVCEDAIVFASASVVDHQVSLPYCHNAKTPLLLDTVKENLGQFVKAGKDPTVSHFSSASCKNGEQFRKICGR